MLAKSIRRVLIALEVFTASTATGGGIALATGLEGNRFPPELLQHTPFRSYRAPGLMLASVVGGSAALATVATFRRSRGAVPFSVLAGLVMMGWIVGEVCLLDQPESPATTELIYFADGIAMTALGLLLGRSEHRS